MNRLTAIIFVLSVLGSYQLFYEVSGGKSYGLTLPIKIILASSPFVLVISGVGLLVNALI